jgi:polar amino acid transport system permease protein
MKEDIAEVAVGAPGAPAKEPLGLLSKVKGKNVLVTLITLAVVVVIIGNLRISGSIDWSVVRYYFTYNAILAGVARTAELTGISMFVGMVIGVILALMRMSKNAVLSGIAYLYTWFFRATPLLVQILFWYNIALFIPTVTIGIPFGTPFYSVSVNKIITPLFAALLALGLNEGAYYAEIARSGFMAVDKGQIEAAHALGMTGSQSFWKVILPQAMRIVLPPTGNQIISLLKGTSLVSVISMPELLYSAEEIYDSNFQTIPLLIVVSIWYIILTTVLSIIQYFVENYSNRSFAEAGSGSRFKGLFANIFGRFRAEEPAQ